MSRDSRGKRISAAFESKELSPKTWPDFVKLFERHGGVWGGCWCMFYHVPSGWGKRTPSQNRREKEQLVLNGRSHGVLVFHRGYPVGWCQFGPKEELARIDHMRDYKIPITEGLWRITCFFVDKRYRGKGVTKLALRSALGLMKARGAKLVEAYPVDVHNKRYSSNMLWWGTLKLFEEFGFKRFARLGKKLWIVRKQL